MRLHLALRAQSIWHSCCALLHVTRILLLLQACAVLPSRSRHSRLAQDVLQYGCCLAANHILGVACQVSQPGEEGQRWLHLPRRGGQAEGRRNDRGCGAGRAGGAEV